MSVGPIDALILVAWSLSGLLIALRAMRRGHHAMWLVLGLVCGPLTWGFWRASQARHPTAHPQLITAGTSGGGPIHMLVGFDDSDESRAALVTAVDLLDGRLGRLTIATVIDYDTALEALSQIDDAERAAADSRLLEAAALIEGRAGPSPSLVVLAGRPSDALLDYARTSSCSMVVIGGRGRGLSKALLGSTAAALSGGAPVPVLIISSPRTTPR